MEIRISSTLSLLAGLSILLLASVVNADHTCYDTWGNSDENLSPCYSPGTTDLHANTHCCRKGDICLSNGLCISPGSQYIMTQQGCTDKAWGAPCSKYCSKSMLAISALFRNYHRGVSDRNANFHDRQPPKLQRSHSFNCLSK